MTGPRGPSTAMCTGSFAVMGAGGVPPGPGGPLPARPRGLATFVSDAAGSVTHHNGLILARTASGRSVAWAADCGG